MGNLAYQKAAAKQQKISYKGLTQKEREYIRAKREFEQADKELGRFYRLAPRNEFGAVDFQSMKEQELDLFEFLNQKKDRAMKKMMRYETQIDVEYTLSLFQQINLHSMSF